MASCPGPTLEAFVEDALWRPSPELVAAVVAILEPQRERIEDRISDYDEECQSWRDYRNYMWGDYVESDHAVRVRVEQAFRQANAPHAWSAEQWVERHLED